MHNLPDTKFVFSEFMDYLMLANMLTGAVLNVLLVNLYCYSKFTYIYEKLEVRCDLIYIQIFFVCNPFVKQFYFLL